MKKNFLVRAVCLATALVTAASLNLSFAKTVRGEDNIDFFGTEEGRIKLVLMDRSGKPYENVSARIIDTQEEIVLASALSDEAGQIVVYGLDANRFYRLRVSGSEINNGFFDEENWSEPIFLNGTGDQELPLTETGSSENVDLENAKPEDTVINKETPGTAEGAEDGKASEVTEGTEDKENPEATEGEDSEKDSEATEGAEDLEDSEATEGADGLEDSEATEGADDLEDPEATEGADDLEDPEATEGTDDLEDPEATEGTDDLEDPEATEGADDLEDSEATEGEDEVFEVTLTQAIPLGLPVYELDAEFYYERLVYAEAGFGSAKIQPDDMGVWTVCSFDDIKYVMEYGNVGSVLNIRVAQDITFEQPIELNSNIILNLFADEERILYAPNNRHFISLVSDVSLTITMSDSITLDGGSKGGGFSFGDGVTKGTRVSIIGGVIQNCNAAEGAGLYANIESGYVMITGTIIKNCNATTYGGGLYIRNNFGGVAELTDMTFTECGAMLGSAVYSKATNSSVVKISGGIIDRCYETNMVNGSGSMYIQPFTGSRTEISGVSVVK